MISRKGLVLGRTFVSTPPMAKPLLDVFWFKNQVETKKIQKNLVFPHQPADEVGDFQVQIHKRRSNLREFSILRE